MAITEEIKEQVLKEATSATPNFETNYDDERFNKINQDYEADATELENTYGGMIGDVEGHYKNLEDALQQQADKQAQIQQENTDFAIEKIEQQKDQANKDYIKEQSGAYVDWQKQSNKYGAEAEKMASAGLSNTGFSESSQVSVYNTYQNRVATARETLSKIILEYNNNIKEAQLQNNANLAQIYSDLSIKQMELALQGFQYKNQLVLDLADKKQQLKNNKWEKELAIIQQQNVENEMAWNAWQYSDNKAWQTEQAELERKFEAEQNELNRQFEEKMEQVKYNYELKLLDAKTAKEKELAKQEHELEMAKLKQQQQYALAQLDKELANEKALLSYQKSLSGGSAKVSSGSGGKSSAISNTAKKVISKAKSSSSSKVSSSSTKGQEPVNMSSVLALGYGPISSSYLAQLENAGKVTSYVKNGERYFKKVVSIKSLK